MLPLVGKLSGESTGYKSVADWKESFGETEYEPKDLRGLPQERGYSDDSPMLHKDKTHLGDYGWALRGRKGMGPEEALGLPSAKTWDQKPIKPGQSAPSWGGGRPKESVGQVGTTSRPWEASTINKFRSPLFKYLDKKDQKHIRNRLEQYGSPIIDPAPYEGGEIGFTKPAEMDHAKIWDKPKKKVEEELKAILTNKRSI